MKKSLAFLVVLLLFFTGCGSQEDTRTLDDFVQAFQDAGYAVTDIETPYYFMIDAKDGISFYLDDPSIWNIVQLYEYESIDDADSAKKRYDFSKTPLQNGKFLLSTVHEEAQAVFEQVALS